MLRMSSALADEIEALKPAVLARTDLTPRGTVTMAEVLRLVLVRGLASLKRELGSEKAQAA